MIRAAGSRIHRPSPTPRRQRHDRSRNLRPISSTILPLIIVAAAAAAASGWTRTPQPAQQPARSISIIDVRPLRLDDAALRPITSHLFAVRVATPGWTLVPYLPTANAADNRPRSGYWRLYLDGRSLGDRYGGSHIGYTPYLTPGTHWLVAELKNVDSTSLSPAVWSEPVIVHVPGVIGCWQTGWHGTPQTGTPTFACGQSDRTPPPSKRGRR